MQTYAQKLLMLAKESENIQSGNAELERKGWSALMCKFIVSGVFPRGWMFPEISHTRPVRTSMFEEYSCKFLVQNSNQKESN
jgi:hypothetical protein